MHALPSCKGQFSRILCVCPMIRVWSEHSTIPETEQFAGERACRLTPLPGEMAGGQSDVNRDLACSVADSLGLSGKLGRAYCPTIQRQRVQNPLDPVCVSCRLLREACSSPKPVAASGGHRVSPPERMETEAAAQLWPAREAIPPEMAAQPLNSILKVCTMNMLLRRGHGRANCGRLPPPNSHRCALS